MPFLPVASSAAVTADVLQKHTKPAKTNSFAPFHGETRKKKSGLLLGPLGGREEGEREREREMERERAREALPAACPFVRSYGLGWPLVPSFCTIVESQAPTETCLQGHNLKPHATQKRRSAAKPSCVHLQRPPALRQPGSTEHGSSTSNALPHAINVRGTSERRAPWTCMSIACCDRFSRRFTAVSAHELSSLDAF